MVRASHILVDNEERAKYIRREITFYGKNFGLLARKYSTCISSQNGGDLGEFEPGKMVREFEEATNLLKINEISPVIRTEFGYHVIKRTG